MPSTAVAVALGALALCSPRIVLPRGAALYCHAEATNQSPIAMLRVQLVTATGRDVTTAGFTQLCAAGGCATLATAVADGFTEDRRARRCQVLLDPANAALEAHASVHVDGVAYDLGPLLPCTIPRNLRLCPVP